MTPTWTDVLARWRSARVPGVPVLPFAPESDNPYEPWVRQPRVRLVEVLDNPRKDTARHLAVVLRRPDQDILAAFKILGSLRHDLLVDELRDQIEEGLKPSGLDSRSWWHHRAQHVLPRMSDAAEWRSDPPWQQLVDAAARRWTEIAQRYAVVRIPKFLNLDAEDLSELEKVIAEAESSKARAVAERVSRVLSDAYAKTGQSPPDSGEGGSA